MSKSTLAAFSKDPIQQRRLISSWFKFLASKRTLLTAFLLCTSALGGCATYIPPEISYDAEVPPLPAPPAALDDRPQPLHVNIGPASALHSQPKKPNPDCCMLATARWCCTFATRRFLTCATGFFGWMVFGSIDCT